MKRIITVATALVVALVLSNNVFAHSHLKGSNPGDGETITEPITEIVLEFDGKIEQGSFIEVATTTGQSIELQDIVIGQDRLTGTVSEALENNDYRVTWSIMSADGHPLEGEFSFTVNAPVENEEEVKEEPSEVIDDTTEEKEQSPEDQVQSDEVKEESSFTTIILIALLIAIIVSGVFLITKKGK